MSAETLVPVGSLESVFNVVGILELVFCLVLLIWKKAHGWIMCLTLLCLGAAWVGIERGGSSPDSFKTTKGYEIKWKWSDGSFGDEPEYGWGCSESSYEKAKKQRYYGMHVSGSVSPQFFHPDSLWVAPLIVVALGLIITPQLWPLWYLLLVWLLKPEE